MKPFRYIALLILLGFPLTCLASQKMTLITEEDPPFSFTQDGSLTGAGTEIVREISRRLGIDDNIIVLPWARGYKRLKTEPNVALFSTARTQERESLFHWVGPLFSIRLEFYARKQDARPLHSLDEARQVGTVATYKDDFREELLQSMGFTNLDSSNSPHSNVRKLMSGRVNLWFHDNIGAPQVARESGIAPENIESVFTFQEQNYYIALSKQTSPAIVGQWQTTLDDMKADGTVWWLTRKWLPADAILVDNRQKATPFSVKLYTEDAPPSSYQEKGRLKGLSVEIVREILRRIGQPDTIEMVPWARGYKLTLTDANTALFSTTRLPQRESLFTWVGPLYQQRWGFYRWKGSGIQVADMEAAKRVNRIGTYHQDAKMQYLQARGFENLVPTNHNINNVMHLKKGNIDLWVSSDFNMPHLVRQAGVSPSQLELAYAFHTVGNYITFSKVTSPHVVRLWQAVFEEMKADGSYQRIRLNHGVEAE